MSKLVVKDVSELVGNTPLVSLRKAAAGLSARVLVKLEYFNPLGSVKDRIGREMIIAAERAGKLGPGKTIVEPTSGNTGIALAYIGAVKGYRVLLTMPDTMSMERRKLLKALGAGLYLTPGAEGMKGAMAKAEEIAAAEEGIVLNQFENPANPEAHRLTTGPEIWDAAGGTVDVFVAGVGTGGTISGVSEMLKEKNPRLISVAVEPEGSPVISGGSPGPHKIQGIGAGFIPKNLNRSIIDRIMLVRAEDAGAAAREIAATEGIFTGISGGANIWAALQLAKEEEFTGKTIVTVACDTGERYVSTWLYGGDET